MNKKFLGIAVLIIVIVGGGFLWSRNRDTDSDSNTANNTNLTQSSQVSYTGVEGQTALALLKSTHTVETKTYSFGEMVTSIDGQVATDGQDFWEFKVNGESASVGAGDYQTKGTDQITWELSKINAQ